MKPCVLIPIYDHPDTIRGIVSRLEAFGLPCLVVDDGSASDTQRVLDQLRREFRWLRLERLPVNRGRGAALRHGYRVAADLGFTHAVQLDADGQHDPADVPAFLDAARRNPAALILGAPEFDQTAPIARLYGRRISQFWVWVETCSLGVADPLCGFRCVPLGPATTLLEQHPLGDRMEFDPQLIVRLVWAGIHVVNVPTRVRYPHRGVSHFRLVRDNVRITWAHTRLVAGMLARLPAVMKRTPLPAHSSRAWDNIQERGSLWGMRMTARFHRLFGHRLSALFILPIVLYFFLTDRPGRWASGKYLTRIHAHPMGRASLGHQPGVWTSLRHYMEFAYSLLDRATFWSGRTPAIQLTFHGREHFERLLQDRQGAILLGAHLGSFDALRMLAEQWGVIVNVLMSTRHAPRITRVLRELGARADIRIIEIDEASSRSVFQIKACLERGEFVAILGDRVGQGPRARAVRAEFLGSTAPFSPGPFLLASHLGCPVLLMVALRTALARYEIFAEVLAERIDLPRTHRAEQLERLVQAYARRLEAYCLRAPYQWFNFFDFWGDGEAA